MEKTVGLVSTCGRELLRWWWWPIRLTVSFMVFTASVCNILDTPRTWRIVIKQWPGRSQVKHTSRTCDVVKCTGSQKYCSSNKE
jgi:hypothetical protein